MSPIGGMGASDARRWVLFVQFGLAACLWWALSNAFELTYRLAGIPQYRPFGIHDASWIAFAVTGATLIYVLRNAVVQEFADDVMVELRKVTWPSWKETRQSTIVVIITVFIVGGILGAFDLLWAKLTQYLLTMN